MGKAFEKPCTTIAPASEIESNDTGAGGDGKSINRVVKLHPSPGFNYLPVFFSSQILPL